MPSGNKSALLSGFLDAEGQPLDKSVRTMFLDYDEDSLTARLEKIRGHGNLNQVEKFYIVSKDILDLVDHKRLNYNGSNRGNSVAFVKLPLWTHESVWQLQVKVKRELIRKAGLVPPTTSLE